jgi:hypothetical protein
MDRERPPQIDSKFADLPTDPKERHEILVDLFGHYVLWLRNRSLRTTRQLAESEEMRAGLGTIRSARYDELAAMPPEQREAAYKAAEATVDRFIESFLTLLSGTGADERLGEGHAVRFRLDLEICEVESMEVVGQETLNRGGEKFFAGYWGRWLNRFGSV